MEARTLIVGIDEAGYGPILGPLVVSAAAFEVPTRLSDACLWEQLCVSVSPSAARRDARLPILDSKKLYRPKEGLARLERSVLAVLGAWRGWPPNLRALLTLIAPQSLPALGQYPWYGAMDEPLPFEADAGSARIGASLLRRDMESRGLRVAGCWSEVLPEGHYNALVGRTQNKAVVLLGLTWALVQRVAEAHPDRRLCFVIDKQGARSDYSRWLLRSFEGRRLKVLREGPEESAYEMSTDVSWWRISFQQSGEGRHLPIALASMVSKYVRELLMARFNEYWRRHDSSLRPTAGYYEDGLRFLGQIRPHLARLNICTQQLVRQR